MIALKTFFLHTRIDSLELLALFLPLLFLFIVLGVWLYDREKRPQKSVVPFPPKGGNSLESGFLMQGIAQYRNVASLLLDLAVNGYLTIKVVQEKLGFITFTNYTIHRIKEYDGENPSERLFLNGLFRSAEGNTRLEVKMSELDGKFYQISNEIIKNMNQKENRETLFKKGSLYLKIPIFILILISFVAITAIPMFLYGDPSNLIPVFFLSIFGIIFVVVASFSTSGSSSIFGSLFPYLFGLFFVVGPVLGFVLPTLLDNPISLIVYVIGTLSIVAMFFLNKTMPKRTPLGNELLGRAKGLKHFLITAKKEEIEALMKQRPNYFYALLPYSYSLGVFQKWMSKGVSLHIPPPNWFEAAGEMSPDLFAGMMNKMLKKALTAISFIPKKGGRRR